MRVVLFVACLSLCTPAAVGAQPSGQESGPKAGEVVRPDWIRMPTARETRAAARRHRVRGFGGTAVLRCTVTVAGTLDGCEVINDASLDDRLSAAALELAQIARFRPFTRDGVPEPSSVVIPFRLCTGISAGANGERFRSGCGSRPPEFD